MTQSNILNGYSDQYIEQLNNDNTFTMQYNVSCSVSMMFFLYRRNYLNIQRSQKKLKNIVTNGAFRKTLFTVLDNEIAQI